MVVYIISMSILATALEYLSIVFIITITISIALKYLSIKYLSISDDDEFSASTKQTNGNMIICSQHGVVARSFCAPCAKKLYHDYCITSGYMSKRLMLLSVEEIAQLREENSNNLLGRKKLNLLLDLDHTLIHSVSIFKLTAEEKYLYTQTDSLPDSLKSSLHRMDGMYRMVKLRPFVHSFLKEASELFDMYICTLSERSYALEMVKLLDPDNVYFNNYSKVIAREDCTSSHIKSLDVFLGKENAVVILDDTKEAWVKNNSNLIVAERYNYFVQGHSHRNYKSYSVLKTDECESTGTLATALNVLQCIHDEFFDMADQDKDLAHQDVRQVLRMMVGDSNPEKTLIC